MRSLLTCALLLLSARAAAQGPEALAQRRYEEGLAAREAGRHEEALERFRASNEIYASPNSRLMIARSLRDLGRVAEAWGEYRLTAARARDRAATEPRYADALQHAIEEGEPLRALIGRLSIALTPADVGATIEVQGRTYPEAALGDAIAVDPGAVTVRASAPGFVPAEATLRVQAGAEARASLTLAPAPDLSEGAGDAGGGSAAPWEPLGITFGSVAVVGAILWPVFYALAQDRFDMAEAMCAPVCPPDTQSTIDEGRAFEAATNVSWVAALFGATSSVTFFLLAWL